MTFADRVHQIQPSQTLGITALVETLRRQGKDIIGLGAGEPDFDTPQIVKEAAIQAIRDGYTKYTPVSGAIELKEAVCEKYNRENGRNYTPAEVLISSGAKHALVNVLLALCGKGDEIIIPSPFWNSYIEQARFVDATPVIIETDEGSDFKITPEQLQQVITARTKALLLNSPSNPTGTVYTKSELEALLAVCEQHDFHIVFDEIYEKITYDGHEHVSLAAYPELGERAVLINGVSKTFAMTGWRIGFAVASAPLIKACTKIQSHTTSNPCSISQRASIAALQADRGIVDEMVAAFDARRMFLTAQLNETPGLTCVLPRGAFYTFPNVTEYLNSNAAGKTISTPMDLCEFLLEQAGVAVVPGEAFGSNQHVRISYATSMQNLEQAVNRIRGALAQLR